MNEFLSILIAKNIKAQKWQAPFQLPKFQSHRGFWKGGLQENTIEAFRAARKLGAEMIECDLQLSKDKIPIVFHDTDLKRIAGQDLKVKDLTAAELRKRANVPTLASVLEARDIPNFINIELKTKSTWNESLERRVCDVIKAADAAGRVIFSSFNPISLWKMSSYAPKIPRALLVSNDPSEDNRIYLREMWTAPLLSIHMLNLDYNLINESNLSTFKTNEVPIIAWTVNDKKIADALLAKGVASIISDEIFEN